MPLHLEKRLTILFLFLTCFCVSQNQTKKWYFGTNAGLDFSTNPPTSIAGAMSTSVGCSSIADASGNLLFYTDGVTVWDQTHSIMANGTSLLGTSGAQTSVIVKKPLASSLYYIFTVEGSGGNAGLNYSVVDMSLASGNGSVTIKNAPLFASGCEEKISAVKHCNQTDIWVMIHPKNTNNFKAYLLTSAGVSATAVTSTAGTTRQGPSSAGSLKFSPNSKKLAEVFTSANSNGITLINFGYYEFDNLIGSVANFTSVYSSTCTLANCWAYGSEFSPDGTKIYFVYHGYIYQHTLCNLPFTGLGNLGYVEGFPITYSHASLQLGPDGKIYVAKAGSTALDVINNPNNNGTACNYSINGCPLSTGTVQYGLPNFVTSFFEQTPGSFTYTYNALSACMGADFTPPSFCSLTGYSVNNVTWNFGDPLSGSANTSTVTYPSHLFSGPGTYTTQLIIGYQCGKTDTLLQTLSIASTSLSLSISSTSINCNAGFASVNTSGGVGPFSYSWSPGNYTTTSVNNLSPGAYTVSVTDNSNGCMGTLTTTLMGAPNGTINTSNIKCNAQPTGSVSIQMSGGTGSYSYSWSNSSANSPSLSGLSAGAYTIVVTDLNSFCTYSTAFQVSQPSVLSLGINSTTLSACLGSTVHLSAVISGGTPPYAFSWSGGPSLSFYNVNQSLPGTYNYSLLAHDANSCSATSSVSIQFLNKPLLASPVVSVCPNSMAIVTLSVSGAASYVWQPGNHVSNSITVSSNLATIYTITGTSNGCSSTITTSAFVFPAANVIINNNSPLCAGETLTFTAQGSSAFSWAGPSGFLSSTQNPTLITTLNNAGTYTLNTLDQNSCTSVNLSNVIIKPSPSVTITGPGIICEGEKLLLTANGANTYVWNNLSTGPLLSAYPAQSASYTVTGTAQNLCTNKVVFNVTVSKCDAIQELKNKAVTSIYPNPTSGMVIIELSQTFEITLYNTLGSVIFKNVFSSGRHEINISHLASGPYLLRMNNAHEGLITYKIFKVD